ncbi:MAG TPA: protein kinase [Sandaracinaceae bacterium LLY-WYZ-13_1]|nr:protein kinase [Sandaracinaceae bacterium LLY-WYZ-13_1]
MSERRDGTQEDDAPERPTPSARVGLHDTDSRTATMPGLSESRSGLPTHLECPECGRANPGDARFCAGCGERFGDGDEHDGGADPLLGRVIADRYRIEELLGRGGMGVVYRVEHARIGKLMAMKLLHGALARDRDVVKRFKREAEAVSRLDHPNTVQVFDFGQSEGMMYLVMEYLPGRDLGQLVKEEGALPFHRVARIAAQVCGSVAQAHELGIVHRDLKPENIMVLEDRAMPDFVKVLDFGLAKLREHEEGAEKSITRAGSILGTPYYMAPEHIRGEQVDARSDVYAMGALLYKAITGVPPFWASSPVGVLTMHLTEEVVAPTERAAKLDLAEEADAIVLKAMAKDPRDRYQSMDELRGDLIAYLSAVGQAEGLESGKLLRLGGGVIPTDSGRQRKVATRGDVDEFERRIRRRSIAGYALAGLLLLGAGAGGAWAWSQRPVEQVTAETEPNDEIVDADPLPRETPFEAYLGERLDEQRSDADFYLLRNPGGERRTVRIAVSAIPNMDLTFEVYRDGISSPLLTADSGGMGQPEVVPNFVIEGPTYYVRVRELWESGRLPTENVSDPYAIEWSFVEPAEDDEREINDSLELAGTLGVGQSRRGYVGWGGDVDVYCLAEDATDVVARLEAVPSLDMILERVDRTTGRVARFDENRVGGDERTDAVARASAGQLCFEVSARRPKEALGNDPEQRYRLHLEHGAGDADEDAEPEDE